ncbi:MAG: insulinase family protein [Anaerolineales bacterium]
MSFTLLRKTPIPELNAEAFLYRHDLTGARLLSVHTDDENKVFGISFRTPPEDSTGIAHIMEHSVLCGSRKYPVKEPFVELMKGSLNTFLNAFTYPDRTCYPVASQNLQDFYNLVDVYLDAVFHPLIPEHTLQQEGWHYHIESPDEPLTFKGVVFNEMKGAYSSPESLLGERSQHAVFPDTPYGVDSGGDPEHIPDLTYEQFKRFHETRYHPANAYIYFYGDGPDEQTRLSMLEGYLSEFSPRQVDIAIPLQPVLPEPRWVRIPYESDTPKGYLAVNFLLPEQGDLETDFLFAILDYVLMGTPGSVLRRTLLESGLGEDVIGGLSSELRQMYYTAGLKGIAVENAHQVEDLIIETLRQVAAQGVDPEEVAAGLNTLEFALRENNTGSFPRGLALMLRALPVWMYGRDPIDALAYEKPLQAVRRRLAQPGVLEDLIRRYLLENSHRVSVLLEPDPEEGRRREAREQARLAQVRAAMSEADIQHLVAQTRELQRLQSTPDSPEALATIPTLRVGDLPRDIRRIPTEIETVGQVPLLHHDLFTNGILYLDLAFDLHTLSAEDLSLVPLFGRALTEMGTHKEDYVRLLQRIGKNTGGIEYSHLLSAIPGDPQGGAWFFLHGKATLEHAADLLSIVRDILFDVNLDDRERFMQMVLESRARMEAGLVPGGHTYVNRRLNAHLHTAGWASEQMSGLSALEFMRGLGEQVQQNWESVRQRLERIRSALLSQHILTANVTLDEANWRALRPQVEAFLSGIPAAPRVRREWPEQVYPAGEGFGIPAQVHYVGKAISLAELGVPAHGSQAVIRHYLNSTYLWEKVRVQGGAYGGFNVYDRLSGVWAFISYRDPNLQPTLQAYDGVAHFLRSQAVSRDEVERAIIGVIGEMDDYQLPDARGLTALQRYLLGITDEERQRWREEVLGTTPQDLRTFGDVLSAVVTRGCEVVIGPSESVEAVARERNWIYRKVL